jgi:hypothetical protein
VCGRNLITGLTSAASPNLDILSSCKVGQKLGVSLPLLTCFPSASGHKFAGFHGGCFSQLGLSTTHHTVQRPKRRPPCSEYLIIPKQK